MSSLLHFALVSVPENDFIFDIASLCVNFDEILFPFVEPTFHVLHQNEYLVNDHSKLFNHRVSFDT